MGAALLTQPDKVRDILTKLVSAVSIPVTAKIRLLPNMEDTLKLVDVIQETGVAALAVHGRTKAILHDAYLLKLGIKLSHVSRIKDVIMSMMWTP